jgi:diaminohydroxyphosphoribosylaminopyrimidine deaminase/5-amino-6-(5-phosphoribosylamino)uracil reductase
VRSRTLRPWIARTSTAKKEPTVRDDDAMARALALGATARRRSAPNPWVGCVIVRDGEVVGVGATEPPGGAHAEVVALRETGPRAKGATAYVTLEPCAHQGRTGPCADALIDAGLSRVVIATSDPDEHVDGRGAARLRAAGVEVVEGVQEREARSLLAPYLHHRQTGRAYCVVKAATSLDGRIAAADGSSQWITSAAARADAHALRADSQAVVIGAGTAIADRPSLTVRDVEPAPRVAPLRVVLDATGRVAPDGPLFDPQLAPTLVITTDRAPSATLDAWRAAGAKVESVDPAASGNGVDLHTALHVLGRFGVLQAMVEGGAALHGALLEAQLVDRVVAYVAPGLLGARGKSGYGTDGPTSIEAFERWQLVDVRRIGDDVRLDYEVGAR